MGVGEVSAVYELWTLDPMTGKQDRKIAHNIDLYQTAEERAEAEARDRERTILILRDNDFVNIIYPGEGWQFAAPA